MAWVDHSDLPANSGTWAAPIVTPSGDLYVVCRYLYKWIVDAWVAQGTYDADGEPGDDDPIRCAVALSDTLLFWVLNEQSDGSAGARAIVYDTSDDSWTEYDTAENVAGDAGSMYAGQGAGTVHPDGDRVVIAYGTKWTSFHNDASPHWETAATAPFQWDSNPKHGVIGTLGPEDDQGVYVWDYEKLYNSGYQSYLWQLKADLSGWEQVYLKPQWSVPSDTDVACYFQRSDRILFPRSEGSPTEQRLVTAEAYQAAPLGEQGALACAYAGSVSRYAEAYRWVHWAPPSYELTDIQVWGHGPSAASFAAAAYGDEVHCSWDYSDAEGWDQAAFEIHLDQGAVTVYDSGEVSSVAEAYVVEGVADGTYTPKLRVQNEDGEWSAWVTGDDVVVASGGGGGEAPVVTITQPLPGSVAGTVDIRATITDDVAVVSATAYVEGQPLGTLAAPNFGDLWRWLWDTTGWANGDYTIEVRAWDTDGNQASDTVEVSLGNSLADQTVDWISVPAPGELTNWEEEQLPETAIMALEADAPPDDPQRTYNVRAYVGDGAGVDLDEFVPIELNRAHGIPAAWDSVRWGLRAQPAQALAYFTTAAEDIVAMCLYETYAALLTQTPTSLLRCDGTEVTELADLSGYDGTPRSVAYAGGKLLIAVGTRLLAYDLDTDELTLEVTLPGAEEVRAVASKGTEEAWVAADAGAGGRLFAFSYDAPVIVDDVEQILALHPYGTTTVLIGCDGGKVYASNGGPPVLSYATGEDAVLSLHELSGMVLAGTQVRGRVFRSFPAWAQDVDFLMTEVRALGEYRSKAFAGGNSARLWRRDDANTWALALELDEVTAINCLLGYTDANGAESLLIGTSGEAARLYRLETTEPTAIQTGVSCPDIGIAVLRRRPNA